MSIVLEVLKVGYYKRLDKSDCYLTDCTCTLIKTEQHKILVDPLGVYSRDFLVQKLKESGIKISDITIVVCTHGHSDHIGNLGLFPNAKHIVGFDVNIGDNYYETQLRYGYPYEIIEGRIEVIPTPGHTCHDISVVVKNCYFNDREVETAVVAGDLFENSEDEDVWKLLSSDVDKQKENREKILEMAQLIIPGHGEPFFSRH